MDGARRCYFPNYRMGDHFQPSHWPLSHIRSSVRSQDDSSRFDTFEMEYVGGQPIPIPYQQRTITSLTGRSWQESFAGYKRKRSSPCLGPPPPPSVSPGSARKTPDPQYPLRSSSDDEARPSESISDQEMGTTSADATNGVEETNRTPKQLCSYGCKQCDMIFACDSDLQRHNQKHNVGIQDKRNFSTSTIPIEGISSSSRSFSNQRIKPQQLPLEPSIVSPPPSSHIHIQDKTAIQQASLSPLLSRGGDDDTMEDDESGRTTKVKKPKQKSNQQGSHICKVCDISFTRHFDLLRHNQKHQVESEEDMSRRTCTNCDRILSRVDATKRHVDTLPESCNYLLRKQGLRPLPAMPADHYDACREQYYKLAQERKKPRGRKKANPAM